jgi:hypothetical protein
MEPPVLLRLSTFVDGLMSPLMCSIKGPFATGVTAAETVATDQGNNQPNDSGDVFSLLMIMTACQMKKRNLMRLFGRWPLQSRNAHLVILKQEIFG